MVKKIGRKFENYIRFSTHPKLFLVQSRSFPEDTFGRFQAFKTGEDQAYPG